MMINENVGIGIYNYPGSSLGRQHSIDQTLSIQLYLYREPTAIKIVSDSETQRLTHKQEQEWNSRKTWIRTRLKRGQCRFLMHVFKLRRLGLGGGIQCCTY